MKIVKINKKNWAEGLDSLAGSYSLSGPVKENGYHNFKKLNKGELPDFDFLNTKLSSKSFVFPQSEVMLEYSLDETADDHHIMKEVKKDYSKRAVVGMRPCDAKALMLVKMNFDTADYQDPYWLNAFNATTFVGLACDNPESTCFCTSAGCGPYHEDGLDVLLSDAGDHYIAKALTQKGEELLSAAKWQESADASVMDKKKAEAEAQIASTVKTDQLKKKATLDLHSASFWDDIAFACINCGTCTYACPTCWCFDIQDETKGNKGIRMKNWDTCMSPLFTLHTTGHNPRGDKTQRVRQRFMHKLKYFVDKYDKGIMCVGCGRCIRQCPVNIDIRSICDKMNRYEPAEQSE
ncbi:MAG: 4Fe-4S dicluster domain-containing protein [Proteobacteria bacterium]|nr:4Fe-4S dicluster domain-containing protein [Pseudomonadota bacterium]